MMYSDCFFRVRLCQKEGGPFGILGLGFYNYKLLLAVSYGMRFFSFLAFFWIPAGVVRIDEGQKKVRMIEIM